VLTWRYQKEEFQKQGAIRDVPVFGRFLHLRLLNVLSVENIGEHTGFAPLVDFITASRLSIRTYKLFLKPALEVEKESLPRLLIVMLGVQSCQF
jgi:hypothetical protein